LQALHSLLIHCPDIHHIALRIVDFTVPHLRPERQFANAVTLELFNQPLQWSEVLPVAKYLTNLLSNPPNLFMCAGEEWIMVANSMREFHRVRAEGRLLALNGEG